MTSMAGSLSSSSSSSWWKGCTSMSMEGCFFFTDNLFASFLPDCLIGEETFDRRSDGQTDRQTETDRQTDRQTIIEVRYCFVQNVIHPDFLLKTLTVLALYLAAACLPLLLHQGVEPHVRHLEPDHVPPSVQVVVCKHTLDESKQSSEPKKMQLSCAPT